MKTGWVSNDQLLGIDNPQAFVMLEGYSYLYIYIIYEK